MADVLKEFLVSIGFAADESGARKVEATIAKTEAGITATSAAESAKRTETEEKASDARVTIAEALSRLLNLEEQKLSDSREKARKQDVGRDQKSADEQAKKARVRRETALKEMQAGALKLAAFATKAIAAVEATALGIVYAADKAAQGFERLNYSSQRIGASAKGINAIEYAVGQLGGTTEGAHQALEKFGDRMRIAPAETIALLDSLKVQTKDAQGSILSTEKLWTNLMDQLKTRPYREGVLRAEAVGTDEQTFRAAIDPRFSQMENEQKRIQGSVGADADDAAKSGTAFEQSMRKLKEVIDAIATRVETGIFKSLTPELDTLATWATDHGAQIAEIISRIAEDIIKLANAVLEKLSKVNWNGVLSGVESFVKSFDKIATAAFGEGGSLLAPFALFGAALGLKVLGPLNAIIAAMATIGTSLPSILARLGLLNPAVLGAVGVAAVLASGDPKKAVLDGGHPDLGPRDNDLGLPGLEHEDVPENKTPSDASRPVGVWNWIKKNALLDFGKAQESLKAFGKATGFGDKVRDGNPPAITATSPDPAKQVTPDPAGTTSDKGKGFWSEAIGYLKTKLGLGAPAASEDARVRTAILNTDKSLTELVELEKRKSLEASGDGVGGSGEHFDGTKSPGASLGDRIKGGRGSGGPDALSTQAQRDNAASVQDELQKAGLPMEGAAAAMGSAQTESSFNPAVPENSYNKGHHGLWQWDSERWPKIEAWIKRQGGDPMDARWQTRAFVAEGRAKPGDPIYDGPQTHAGFAKLEQSAGDLGTAVQGMRGIERFGSGEEGGRTAHASRWLDAMRGGGVGSAPKDDAAGLALSMQGMGEGQSAHALSHIMHAGEWCADFMNGVIEKSGGKGSGSAMADSFAKWGKPVSTSEAKRGDVILENSGSGTRIHHVGMATGNVKRDAQGNVTHVEMISGNYGHMVRRNMEPIGIIAGMRRGEVAQPKVASTADGKPVHVEVTDSSAAKIGKAMPASGRDAVRAGEAAQMAARHAHALKLMEDIKRHGPMPLLHHPLGVTPALRASIDNSRTRTAHLEKHETFHIHGGDPKTMMAEAKRQAGRGNADLIRNLQTAEV